MTTVGQFIHQRYEVVDHLGNGTFGEAWEVRDHHLDKMVVALKLLDPAKVGAQTWAEPSVLTRFEDHNVLRVWNADFAHGRPYVVTELAPGGSLDKSCDHHGWPIADATRAIRDACRGVQRIHQGGFVHRDIKLENLFIADDDRTLVGDLGLAAKLDSSGKAPPTGTPATLAPEAITPAGQTSTASDVYSLGASLYRLLTGTYPTLDIAVALAGGATVDLASFYSLRLQDKVTPVRDLAPHVDRKLASRVAKALALDPGDRFQSALEFNGALGELRDPPTRWQRVTPTAPDKMEFRASRPGRPNVIATVAPEQNRLRVTAKYQPSGRTVASTTVPPSRVPAELRRIVATIG